MTLSFAIQQMVISPADHLFFIETFADQSQPKAPDPQKRDPNWPSKKPGKRSGGGRDNNPPKRK